MHTHSLVSINLYCNEDQRIILLNNTGMPMLFYWNGKDDVYESILKDDKFRILLDKSSFNYERYTTSYLSYLMFILDEEEHYEDKEIAVQDLYKLSDMTDIESSFYISYLLSIFKNLYSKSLKTEYEGDILLDDNEKIVDIYKRIQTKFPEKFIKITVINYIRSELLKNFGLTQDNSTWIINKLNEILINEK